jgi:hypothetical protein
MLLPTGVDLHRFVPHRQNTSNNKSSSGSGSNNGSINIGRQRAVDALLDSSAEGSYYRAMNIQVCWFVCFLYYYYRRCILRLCYSWNNHSCASVGVSKLLFLKLNTHGNIF